MARSGQLKIGIIGDGKMGGDIFYYLAGFDFAITWVCLNDEKVKMNSAAYLRKLERRLKNGLIGDPFFDFRKAHTKITCTLRDLAECDFIIEAVTEDAPVKNALFRELENFLTKDTIVVSNSSSIKPSSIFHNLEETGRCAGLHFFYPVQYKNIAELIAADFTNGNTVEKIKKFLSAIDKNYLVMHERDGFLLNRILLDCQAQACRYYQEGDVLPHDLDAVVRRDIFPIGIFEFFDSVGIDVMYQSVLNYTEGLGDREFYRPILEVMKQLMQEGRLGRKSGAGFYDFNQTGPELKAACSDALCREISSCLVSLFINSSFKALEKNICPPGVLENAVKEYMGVDTGPFTLADEMGRERIRETLLREFERTGFLAFLPSRNI